MRIALIAPFAIHPKGTTRWRVLPLARALAEQGHAVRVVIPPYDWLAHGGMTWQDGGVQMLNVAVPAQLSLVGHESTQGVGPRDFTIDPSGALLLVANQDTDTVVSFWINQDSGMLNATGHVAKVPTPVCLHLVSA